MTLLRAKFCLFERKKDAVTGADYDMRLLHGKRVPEADAEMIDDNLDRISNEHAILAEVFACSFPPIRDCAVERLPTPATADDLLPTSER